MRQHGFQLGRRQRRLFYLAFVTLLLSGLFWAWLHRLDETETSGSSWRGWTPRLMTIHGGAAVGFVLLLGTLLPGHVRHSWRAGRNRPNGVFFLSAVGVLTITGYALYYLGDETARRICSDIHFWLGVAFPLLLVWHIRSGRAARSNR